MPEVTWIHPWLSEILKLIPINVKSLIDIGCGRGIIGAIVRIYRELNRLVGIDIFKPYLDFCHKINVYDELYELDLRKIPLPFDEKEFDVAACIEVIEHVPKENGLKLLKELERIAKIVIVSAPNVFFYQKAYDNNPFQKHVSEWRVKDFTKQGYKVLGVGNFIVFGRYNPYLSTLLSKFSYMMPTFSDTLLAYKTTKELNVIK